MTETYRLAYRGKVFNFLLPFTRYVFVHITTTLGILLFYILNRPRVIGRKNIPLQRNVLLLSNHQSLIDSFVVGTAAYYGPSFFRPYLTPWNPAAEENFYSNKFIGWWSDQWKCIPVRRGRRDLKALHQMMEALKSGTMLLFPEGTRSRDGEIGKGRPGAGLVILADEPVVIPVTIDGMNEVLPIGASVPRVFKRVTIVFGKPVDYSDFLGQDRSKETAQKIVDRVMNVLREQLEEIRRPGGLAKRS